jgi:HlyD family secretion protein
MSIRVRQIASRAVLPLTALGLFVFAVSTVIQPPRSRADPPTQPASSGFGATLAGTGVVEPRSEMIAVATELPGVVRSVSVAPGERVSAGQTLFTLDARAAAAGLAAARADAASALAAAAAAEVVLADERQRLSLFEQVDDPRALSADEIERRRFAVRRAAAALDQARAQARAAQAMAGVRQTDLDRLTVTAPIDGRVYRVNVRPGEYAAAGPAAQPLMTLGADGALHVRAEFDEADAPRLRPGARAQGVLRGQAAARIPLTFVRLEPQVVDKRALSGGSERVDTRVVQALYRFEPGPAPVYLGQRMDVFVEAAGAGSRQP